MVSWLFVLSISHKMLRVEGYEMNEWGKGGLIWQLILSVKHIYCLISTW